MAGQAGSVIGYITTLVLPPAPQGRALWERLPRPYVGCLVVSPRHQRQGIGLRLVNATVSAALGARHIRALSDHLYLECSDALVPVYAKMGFERLAPAQIVAMAGMPARANVMRRPLAP